jgi:ADP-ribose pyrophosphatase
MDRPDDKINARAYGWQRLATDYPYTYRMFRVRRDQVRWPDGHVSSYAYVLGANAIWVVPVTSEGQIVLIRQFRYTIDSWSWEVPAGGFHDFAGDPVDLAKKELAEEIGGKSDNWLYVGFFRPGVSTIDEIIEVHVVPLERALEMARNGEMVDGHSALALLRCEPLIR